MATLSNEQLNWYRQSIATEAYNAAESVLKGIDFKNGSVADIRNKTIDAIKTALSVYGDNAQVIASQMFDFIMQKEGNLSAAYKFFTDLIDEDMVESKVKYFANSVIDGKYYKYEKDIKEYTNYLVRRTAHDAMVRNAKNNGLYYALVPTGTETCAFCFMLASRGFVYSEKTQEKWSGGGFHRNCDCVMLPSTNGKLDVYGYDPDALYEKYDEAAKAYNENEYGLRNAKDIVKAIEKLADDKGWDYMYGK